MPGVCRELQRRYIDIALDAVLATMSDPAPRKFYWTCESLARVDDWWRAASPARRKDFLKALRNGQLDVAALPCNQTPFLFMVVPENSLSSCGMNRCSMGLARETQAFFHESRPFFPQSETLQAVMDMKHPYHQFPVGFFTAAIPSTWLALLVWRRGLCEGLPARRRAWPPFLFWKRGICRARP